MRSVILIILLFCSSAEATFQACGEEKSAEEIFAMEDVNIFKAKVTKVWLDETVGGWYAAVNFKLYESFKGNIKKDDTVKSQTPGQIGPEMLVGKTYLFVSGKDGIVDPCITKKYPYGAKIFEQLAKLKYDEIRQLR